MQYRYVLIAFLKHWCDFSNGDKCTYTCTSKYIHTHGLTHSHTHTHMNQPSFKSILLVCSDIREETWSLTLGEPCRGFSDVLSKCYLVQTVWPLGTVGLHLSEASDPFKGSSTLNASLNGATGCQSEETLFTAVSGRYVNCTKSVFKCTGQAPSEIMMPHAMNIRQIKMSRLKAFTHYKCKK